ncbi:hypothetical protein GCM10020220_009060 [Nonomuraea rubra]
MADVQEIADMVAPLVTRCHRARFPMPGMAIHPADRTDLMPWLGTASTTAGSRSHPGGRISHLRTRRAHEREWHDARRFARLYRQTRLAAILIGVTATIVVALLHTWGVL